MSGIAGLIHFDGRPVEPGRIEAMTARMAHRGPDGIAHWQEGSAALGHCMFHTTAESMLAPQPLASEDGQVVVVLDGWIANHDDLTRLLEARGARLRSRADAELVLQAYRIFGEDLGQHLEGDFAIAIRDGRNRKTVCLRDAFSHRPFHYHWDGRTLGLASEVPPLLDLPWVPEELDEATVAEFLASEWHSREASFWQGIRKLPGAHLLVCDAQGPRIRPYWQPDPWAACPLRDEDEAAEAYRALLTESVRRCARSHRPLACEASGGLDSSAIFAVARGLEQTGRLGAPGLMGYTFALPEGTPSNDLPHARSLARFLGTGIREIPQTPIGLEDYIAQTRQGRSFAGEPAIFAHHGLMRDARSQGCAVVLTGGGGDEWLWLKPGLDYAAAMRAGDWSGLGIALRADLRDYGRAGAIAMLLRHGLGSNLPGWLRALRRRVMGLDRGGPVEGAVYRLTPRMLRLLETRRAEAAAAPPRRLANVVQKMFEQRLTEPSRAWGFDASNRAAATLPIERRLPFEDRRIVQFAYSMPAWMARRGTVTKALHRRAFSDCLPADILGREDKAWMLAPYEERTGRALERLRADRIGTAQGWIEMDTAYEAGRLSLSGWSPNPENFALLDDVAQVWSLVGAGYVD